MSACEDRVSALQAQANSLQATVSKLVAESKPPIPSVAAVAFATTLLGFLGGYFYGQYLSLRSPPSNSPSKQRKPKKRAPSWPNSYDVTVHPDSSDEELMKGLKRGRDGIAPATSSEGEDDSADEQQAELSTFSNSTEEHKLTLIIRTDLSMTRGKMAAQASHATLANYRYLQTHSPSSPVLKKWEAGGQAKVALQVKSEEEILVLQAQAVSLGLCARVVRDAGRTQIEAGSVTCLGVGPGPRSVVDQVSGTLKLL